MTFCPNGHQLAAADHYCRSCGAARPAGTYEPVGEFARPEAERAATAESAAAGYLPPGAYRAPTIGPYVPAQRYHPPGTNTLAIVSLVLGLVWFYWVGSVLAVILGIVSLRQIRDRDEQGKGLAVAGIVIGLCGILALGLVGLYAFTVVHQTQPGPPVQWTFPSNGSGG
jgi:nitrate reductase NapE component